MNWITNHCFCWQIHRLRNKLICPLPAKIRKRSFQLPFLQAQSASRIPGILMRAQSIRIGGNLNRTCSARASWRRRLLQLQVRFPVKIGPSKCGGKWPMNFLSKKGKVQRKYTTTGKLTNRIHCYFQNVPLVRGGLQPPEMETDIDIDLLVCRQKCNSLHLSLDYLVLQFEINTFGVLMVFVLFFLFDMDET